MIIYKGFTIYVLGLKRYKITYKTSLTEYTVFFKGRLSQIISMIDTVREVY